MGLTVEDNGAVQRHIDEHLDRIDAVLVSGGMSRSERQHILDDVQTQIHDMLAERCEGVPAVDDVRAVLAELDPPESYAPDGSVPESPAAPVTPIPQKRPGPPKKLFGKVALLFVVGGLGIHAVLVILARRNEIPDPVAGFVCSLLGFLISGVFFGVQALPDRNAKVAVTISVTCMIIMILVVLLSLA